MPQEKKTYTKEEVMQELDDSYGRFKALKNKADRTGAIGGVATEANVFLSFYARLLVFGMTDDEKSVFESMASKVQIWKKQYNT